MWLAEYSGLSILPTVIATRSGDHVGAGAGRHGVDELDGPTTATIGDETLGFTPPLDLVTETFVAMSPKDVHPAPS